MSNAWIKHFMDMTRGLIPNRKRFYKIHTQTGAGDIQLVTPTQADVQRAKADMKRKLAESVQYKTKRARPSPQTGSGQKKRKTKKKKAPVKKSKSQRGKKSTKTKSKSKKKTLKNKKKK